MNSRCHTGNAKGIAAVEEAGVTGEPMGSEGRQEAEAPGPKGTDSTVWVEGLVEDLLAHPATDRQVEVVEAQLGRFPRGMVAVGARCVCGNPLAVVTRPRLPDGTPFPTTCYLTSPEAVKAVSRLEADGSMARYTLLIGQDARIAQEYARAHAVYLAFRHALADRLGDEEGRIAGVSAGGMPIRVKCLHALVAQSLVMREGVNPIGDMALDRIRTDFDPSVCRCADPWPGLAGRQSHEGGARLG